MFTKKTSNEANLLELKSLQKKSEPPESHLGLRFFPLNINISGIGWLVGGSFISETFLTICDCVIQLSLNVLLVMDCVTARCGSQVQPTKMTLARQRVLSSSEVRASDLEH